jgi:MFS transporter, ACS family, tartrate transporter
MSNTTDPSPPEVAAVAARVRRKVALRLLPLLLVMYIIAYLDRANLGFAKLQMSKNLDWFTDPVFGLGAGLFFIGYLFLEVPGALLVERWSARKWFARILVTWGVCSMAMALVSTPTQFYIARFLLGLAEAGFFPGVIVYFTHWFPRKERARALSMMILGVPGSLALGARVSAVLLEQDWFDLAGWQWVFIVEGAPAVLLGLVVPFILPDRPRDAKWLTREERAWLEDTLEAERRETAAIGGVGLGQVFRKPTVWVLALGILATNIGGYALVFWLPTAVKGLLAASGSPNDNTAVLNWSGLIYLCGMAGIWVSGRLADWTGERKWCCVAGQVGTAVFLSLSVIPGQPWALVLLWLCLTGFFAFFWPSPFWVLPTLTLTASAAAVAIGVINMCANLAGFIGSPIVGEMKHAGMSDAACLLFLAVSYGIGGVFVAMLRVPQARPTETENQAW